MNSLYHALPTIDILTYHIFIIPQISIYSLFKPIIYQQGQRAGQAGIDAVIYVKDWQFCLANKPENAFAPGMNQNGNNLPNNGGV